MSVAVNFAYKRESIVHLDANAASGDVSIRRESTRAVVHQLIFEVKEFDQKAEAA